MSDRRTLPGAQPCPRGGFTLVELMVIVAVIGLVSAISIRSMLGFLQEQRLRQAALELASYLQGARARAQREGGFCQLTITGTTLAPSSSSGNGCSLSPAVPSLDVAKASAAADVTLSGSTAYPITFTRSGTLASETQSVSALVAMPRLLYLAASGTSQQRCVFLDLVSIRVGWRNGSSGTCTYSG